MDKDASIDSKYPPAIQVLFVIGEIDIRAPAMNYRDLGLGEEHIPALIELATDEEYLWSDTAEDADWAPLHAWRALGQLRAAAAVHRLISLFRFADDNCNDWVTEEMPPIFAEIGPSAIFELRTFLIDDWHGPFSRSTASNAIRSIGQMHPDSRDECVAVLTQALERYANNQLFLNGILIDDLLQLKAIGSANVIKQVFDAGKVEPFFVGDWEDVQIELGLLKERLTPRPTWPLRQVEPAPKQPNNPERKTKKKSKRKRKVKKKR